MWDLHEGSIVVLPSLMGIRAPKCHFCYVITLETGCLSSITRVLSVGLSRLTQPSFQWTARLHSAEEAEEVG